MKIKKIRNKTKEPITDEQYERRKSPKKFQAKAKYNHKKYWLEQDDDDELDEFRLLRDQEEE